MLLPILIGKQTYTCLSARLCSGYCTVDLTSLRMSVSVNHKRGYELWLQCGYTTTSLYVNCIIKLWFGWSSEINMHSGLQELIHRVAIDQLKAFHGWMKHWNLKLNRNSGVCTISHWWKHTVTFFFYRELVEEPKWSPRKMEANIRN